MIIDIARKTNDHYGIKVVEWRLRTGEYNSYLRRQYLHANTTYYLHLYLPPIMSEPVANVSWGCCTLGGDNTEYVTCVSCNKSYHVICIAIT